MGEYITGLVENRMSGKNTTIVTLRELFYESYREDKLAPLQTVSIVNDCLKVNV